MTDYTLTTREDLRQPAFWWRWAFLLLWIAAVLIAAGYNSTYSMALYATSLGYVMFVDSAPRDFAGAVFGGGGMAALVAPGLFDKFQNPGIVYGVTAAFILFGLICGFLMARYIYPRLHR